MKIIDLLSDVAFVYVFGSFDKMCLYIIFHVELVYPLCSLNSEQNIFSLSIFLLCVGVSINAGLLF